MAQGITNKRYYIEFGKIYNRLIEVELQLRERIISSFKCVYKKKAFYRLKPYIYEIIANYNYVRKTDGVSGNHLHNIIKSNKSDDLKLKECIYRLYLPDLLGILDYEFYYRNKLLIKHLYYKKPSHNDVKHYSSYLSKLRNCIMHFNFKKYLNDKINYINALIFFENHLNCFMRPINHLPPIPDVSVTRILQVIYAHYPILFEENDRILCDVFDDIAILNGKPAEDLPQYWSILRQRYIILRNSGKIKEDFEILDENAKQISLF